jgi:hypothetical protein
LPPVICPREPKEAPVDASRGFFMVASVGAPHPWPLAVGEVDVSTFLGLRNYAVAGAFESRRLHPSAPTTQSALEPGPAPREPGFPFAARVAITSQPSIKSGTVSSRTMVIASPLLLVKAFLSSLISVWRHCSTKGVPQPGRSAPSRSYPNHAHYKSRIRQSNSVRRPSTQHDALSPMSLRRVPCIGAGYSIHSRG